MAQNQEQHNTVDGQAPVDQPIIDESGRLDPTREEALRALAIINGDAPPAAAVREEEKKSLIPPVLEDPRDSISKNFRTNRGRDANEAKEDLDIARVDPANQAAIYGSDIAGQPEAQVQEQAAAAAVVQQQPQRFKVKVDGQERDVTQDELIATYQKNQAADQRLAEATRLLNEAKTVRSSAPITATDGASPEADDTRSTMQQEQASIPKGTKFDRAKLANAVEKIAFGTTEEGTDALGELLISVAPQPQSLDINNQVETVLAQRDYRKSSEDTTRKFAEKYPSLATDSIIQSVSGELVAQEMVKDFVKAGISLDVIEKTLPNRQAVKTFYDHIVVQRPDLVRSLDQLYDAASKDARFQALAGAKTVQITSMVDRTERKGMVQQQPAHRTPVSPQAFQSQPASRDQRNSDAVARMRAARGQSTAA